MLQGGGGGERKRVQEARIMYGGFRSNRYCMYFVLVRDSKEPGWLEGTLNGKTGLLPSNYVEFI